MGHNLLFALRYFLLLLLGGMIALNSCKEERASINDDSVFTNIRHFKH